MSEFKRENRYIVIKRRRLLSYAQGHEPTAEKLERRILAQIPEEALVECVVVERDWPEYEQVWSMLAARVDHGDQYLPAPRGAVQQSVQDAERYKTKWLNLGLPDVECLVHALNDGGFKLHGPREAVEHFKKQFSAQQTAAQTTPTSERLPTETDADPWGDVAWYDSNCDEYRRASWNSVFGQISKRYTHWQPTGLVRPAEPGEA